MLHTLSVQEIADWNWVSSLIGMNTGLLEHLIDMALRSDAHILLSEVLDVGVDVGASKLLRQRDLLQRHLVDAGARRAQQRRCGEKCAFHDCGLIRDYRYQSNRWMIVGKGVWC